MNMIFRVFLFVGLVTFISKAELVKESVHTIDHPHKNEYTSFLVGSDKHKYGYELKENRHFHHTTTEEDGVRLGCYGYVLQGKKYSTQYVADVNGYRPVFTHDAITVYPKSGGERKASFIGDFNEDEQRSENIRYFFPDGCKGSDITVAPVVLPMPPNVKIITNSNEPINPPEKIPSVFIGNQKVPEIPTDIFLPPFGPIESQLVNLIPPKLDSKPKPTVSTPATTPATPAPTPVTPATTPATPAPTPAKPLVTPSKAPVTVAPTSKVTAGGNSPTSNTTRPTSVPLLTKIPAPTVSYDYTVPVPATKATSRLLRDNLITADSKESCRRSCCGDNESVAKLILPIPMKSLGKSSGSDSCEKFAKLLIPIEGLNVDSLKTLASGSDSAELIKAILKSLS